MRVKGSWIYGYEDKYLEDSLILCLFSRVIVVGFPLRLLT